MSFQSPDTDLKLIFPIEMECILKNCTPSWGDLSLALKKEYIDFQGIVSYAWARVDSSEENIDQRIIDICFKRSSDLEFFQMLKSLSENTPVSDEFISELARCSLLKALDRKGSLNNLCGVVELILVEFQYPSEFHAVAQVVAGAAGRINVETREHQEADENMASFLLAELRPPP